MKGKTFSLNGTIVSSREGDDEQKIISIYFEVSKDAECRIIEKNDKKILLLKNLLVKPEGRPE